MTLNPVTTPIDWEKVSYLPHTFRAVIAGTTVFMYHNPVLRPNMWHIFIEGSHEPYTSHSQDAAEVSAIRMVELLLAPKREETSMTPPREPNQVPPGDAADAVKPGNPTPSEFTEGDDETDEEIGDDADDDLLDDGDDD